MVGSTYRLLPAAKDFVEYLPLDTLSFRYVAWELLVEVSMQVKLFVQFYRNSLIEHFTKFTAVWKQPARAPCLELFAPCVERSQWVNHSPECSWLKGNYLFCKILCDLQFTGPDVVPFTLERENLVLVTWQMQQSGEDFRIMQVTALAIAP